MLRTEYGNKHLWIIRNSDSASNGTNWRWKGDRDYKLGVKIEIGVRFYFVLGDVDFLEKFNSGCMPIKSNSCVIKEGRTR